MRIALVGDFLIQFGDLQIVSGDVPGMDSNLVVKLHLRAQQILDLEIAIAVPVLQFHDCALHIDGAQCSVLKVADLGFQRPLCLPQRRDGFLETGHALLQPCKRLPRHFARLGHRLQFLVNPGDFVLERLPVFLPARVQAVDVILDFRALVRELRLLVLDVGDRLDLRLDLRWEIGLHPAEFAEANLRRIQLFHLLHEPQAVRQALDSALEFPPACS